MEPEFYRNAYDSMYELGRRDPARIPRRPIKVAHRFLANSCKQHGKMFDLESIKQEVGCECKHVAGYFDHDSNQCLICQGDAAAITEYACFLLQIPILEDLDATGKSLCLRIIKESLDGSPGASRLIFADWLDEHGYPDAELIRVQEQIAVLEPQLEQLKGARIQLRKELFPSRVYPPDETIPVPLDIGGVGVSGYIGDIFWPTIINQGRVVLELPPNLKQGDMIPGIGVVMSVPDADNYAQVELDTTL